MLAGKEKIFPTQGNTLQWKGFFSRPEDKNFSAETCQPLCEEKGANAYNVGLTSRYCDCYVVKKPYTLKDNKYIDAYIKE